MELADTRGVCTHCLPFIHSSLMKRLAIEQETRESLPSLCTSEGEQQLKLQESNKVLRRHFFIEQNIVS